MHFRILYGGGGGGRGAKPQLRNSMGADRVLYRIVLLYGVHKHT